MFENKSFRFRQYSQSSIAEPNNRTLWLASAKDFNDPFEFMYQVDLNLPEDNDALKQLLVNSSQSEAEVAYIESLDNDARRDLVKRDLDRLMNGHVKTLSCT